MEILILIALALFIIYAVKKRQYEKTEYYQQTRNSYLKVLFDKGLLGEFYTYDGYSDAAEPPVRYGVSHLSGQA